MGKSQKAIRPYRQSVILKCDMRLGGKTCMFSFAGDDGARIGPQRTDKILVVEVIHAFIDDKRAYISTVVVCFFLRDLVQNLVGIVAGSK